MAAPPVVLFDLDGTLTDPKVGITVSMQQALASVGVRRRPRRAHLVHRAADRRQLRPPRRHRATGPSMRWPSYRERYDRVGRLRERRVRRHPRAARRARGRRPAPGRRHLEGRAQRPGDPRALRPRAVLRLRRRRVGRPAAGGARPTSWPTCSPTSTRPIRRAR